VQDNKPEIGLRGSPFSVSRQVLGLRDWLPLRSVLSGAKRAHTKSKSNPNVTSNARVTHGTESCEPPAQGRKKYRPPRLISDKIINGRRGRGRPRRGSGRVRTSACHVRTEIREVWIPVSRLTHGDPAANHISASRVHPPTRQWVSPFR